jgi:Undecaprenyl-phosphate glucose phosphotransferase
MAPIQSCYCSDVAIPSHLLTQRACDVLNEISALPSVDAARGIYPAMRQGAALRAISTLPTVPPWSKWHLVAAVQVADAIAVLSASAFSVFVIRCFTDVEVVSAGTALTAAIVMAFVAHCVLRSMGAYEYSLIGRAYASSTLAAGSWCLGISPLLLLAMIRDSQNSCTQYWVMIWLLSSAVLLVFFRSISARGNVALLRSKNLGHTICIIGTGNEARSCASQVQRNQSDIILLGYFWPNDRDLGASIDAPCLGPLSQLPNFLQQHRVDELIVATSLHQREAVEDLISYLRCLPVTLSIWPESLNLPNICIAPSEGSTDKVTLLRFGSAPLQGWRWLQKDVQDRTIALMALLLFLPVFLIVAIGIRLSSPGPVFFRQMREGYCGRQFRMFKFRTMHATASQPSDKLVLATREDHRVYPLGALLRKTSLDELPQLLNVLAGDMWLVGPRPHSPLATAAGRLYPEAVRQYAARHRTKPGITGWAQINGWRGPTVTPEQIEQRVAHDIYYVENWSPLLDLRILAKTAVHGFVDPNAF